MTRRLLLVLAFATSPASAQVLPLWEARQEVVIVGAKAELTNSNFHVDSRGRIYVEDNDGAGGMSCQGEHRFRVLDSTGAPLFTVGRGGKGPGEFRCNPVASGFVGDSLWVWDLSRINVFAPDGRPARSFDFVGVNAGKVGSLKTPKLSNPHLLTFDGRSVVVDRGYTKPLPDSFPIVQVNQKRDPVGVLGWAWNPRPTGPTWFAQNPQWHAASIDGSHIAFAKAILDGPDAGRLQLRVVRLGSKDTVRARFPVAMEPISAGRLDSARASIRANYSAKDVARIEKQPVPLYYPPVSGLCVARNGGVLIQFGSKIRAPVLDYLIVSPTGVPLARLKLPWGVWVQQFEGTTVWGHTRDADGFATIVRYRIDVPPG